MAAVATRAPDRPLQRGGAIDGSDHELLVVRRGRRTGVQTIVAVHSTTLGPALGGCRLWTYPSLAAAIEDALRLSRAMTLKAAAARLPLGGGKAVICAPDGVNLDGLLRRALLHDFADTVNMLAGLYITAEDVGTDAGDMAVLSEFTRYVTGRPAAGGGSGEPGEVTATGVQAAIRACCARRFGSPELAGRSVAVIGVGHVGEPLARSLSRCGAALVLSDIDPARRSLAEQLGAMWLEPAQALRASVDVLAPCALGAVLDEALARELRCEIVCGAANNQLVADEVAEVLAARGVLYAPDFIVNAGGLINVGLELSGYDRKLALGRAAAIEGLLGEILERAERTASTPLAVAMQLARERLAAAAASSYAGAAAAPTSAYTPASKTGSRSTTA